MLMVALLSSYPAQSIYDPDLIKIILWNQCPAVSTGIA